MSRSRPCACSSEGVRGAGGDAEELAVSPLRGAPAARLLVEECLEDRATTEPVGRGRGRLAPADLVGPEPAPVPRGDGDQVPVERRVVEVVEGDRRRELD